MKYLMLILMLPLLTAIDITVDKSGLVSIDGDGFDIRDSQEYTSKERSYWLLNISVHNTDVYEFAVNMPKYTEINYIKAQKINRISDENGLVIEGSGTGDINLMIQYRLGYSKLNLLWLLLLLPLLFFFLPKKRPLDLTSRQQQILKAVRRPMTQASIQKQTTLPKSSVSRNIDVLVKKGYVKRTQRGMSNVIVPVRSGLFRYKFK